MCVAVCASLPFKEEVRNSCGCCGERRLRGVTEEEAERRWEREGGGGGGEERRKKQGKRVRFDEDRKTSAENQTGGDGSPAS